MPNPHYIVLVVWSKNWHLHAKGDICLSTFFFWSKICCRLVAYKAQLYSLSTSIKYEKVSPFKIKQKIMDMNKTKGDSMEIPWGGLMDPFSNLYSCSNKNP